MSDIPEEIRKMFPTQPIHKLDIDDNGDQHILASSEPLSNEPDFEHMPVEQINQYLRDHGYDPEQVKLNGKILAEVLIENLDLRARAEAAERELAELRMKNERLDVTALLSGMPVITSDAIPDGKIFISKNTWDGVIKSASPESQGIIITVEAARKVVQNE